MKQVLFSTALQLSVPEAERLQGVVPPCSSVRPAWGKGISHTVRVLGVLAQEA